MKNTFAAGFAILSLFALAGAGCAPKPKTPPATPPTPPPSAEAPTPTPEPTAPAATKVNGLTQEDLDQLKLDVQGLQTQDLTTLKN